MKNNIPTTGQRGDRLTPVKNHSGGGGCICESLIPEKHSPAYPLKINLQTTLLLL